MFFRIWHLLYNSEYDCLDISNIMAWFSFFCQERRGHCSCIFIECAVFYGFCQRRCIANYNISKISLVIGISVSWILADYIFYLGCVTDIWKYGKAVGFMLIANPGTYMYKINNYGLGINGRLIIQTTIDFLITLLIVWGILSVYLRKREF